VAGAGYRALWRLGRPEIAIILGTNHTGLGGAIVVGGPGEWVTPLGRSPVAEPLAGELARALGAERSDLPFLEEHSVEVQLPFLRYLFGPIPFVPAVVSEYSLEFCLRTGQALARVVDRSSVALIASTDFTHYEPDQVAREKVRRALAHILNLDLEGFLEAVARYHISICGVGAVGILLAAARALGLLGAELLSYRTSGEVVGLLDQVVGYAAVMLREVEAVA
jgi:AmmeMemoRadiSam system protein B